MSTPTAPSRVTRPPPPPPRRRSARRGFTLIEAAMATVIIGVGFTALLHLLASGTVANKEGAEMTTAINLAGNIHEAAVLVGYANLPALEGTYDQGERPGVPVPVDARLKPIEALPGWSQVVDVSYVDPSMLISDVSDGQEEPVSRVTVTVRRNGNPVYRTSWLAAASG